jgi:tripartite-type tricarboxylate transporter receptor subunit TctC
MSTLASTIRTILLPLIAALIPSLAAAQTYPTKPVRVIVPVTAGGLSDVLARAVALELGKAWNQTVIVENRPGAGHIIATELVVKSQPDGYTILMTDGAMIANPFLYRKLPYDAAKDLTPVANMVQITSMLVASPDFPAANLQELVALARAKPGTINYGSFGKGTVTHVDMEAFASRTGIKLTHIPYKGIADVLPALASGQIQIALAGVPPALPLLKQGRIKGIAFAGPQRSRMAPDVPTSVEAGLPALLSQSWTGFFVTALTPQPIVAKIAEDVGKVLAVREFQEKYITGVGLDVNYLATDRFAEFLNTERTRMADKVKNLDVLLD